VRLRFYHSADSEYRQGDMNCINLVRSTHKEETLPGNAIRLSYGPSLADAVTFWAGVTLRRGSTGIEVTTSTGCWSHAAQIPVSVGLRKERADDRLLPDRTKLVPHAMWLPSAFTLSNADVATGCDEIRAILT